MAESSPSPTRKAAWAFLGSLSVYLIPLVHVHGGSLLGMIVFANLSEGLSRKAPLWIAAELGLAALYQAIAFTSLYWFASRRTLSRALLVAGAAVASVPVLYWVLFLALPTRFLIEADKAPERVGWEVVCTVDNAQLAAVDGGPGPEFALARETWLRMSEGLAYRVLSMPDCATRSIPTPFLAQQAGLQRVAPGGALIYSRQGTGGGANSFWYVAGAGADPVQVAPPPDGDHAPMLSGDGQLVAWLSRIRAQNRSVRETRVRIQNMASGESHSIRLAVPERLRIELIDVNAAAQTLTVSRNGETLWAHGFDGAVEWGPVAAPGFRLLGRQTLRVNGDGLVVWDGYRDSGRYRLRWQLGAVEGILEIPLGRNITDVALSPDNRHIAVSVTTALNIGAIPDSVFVIDTVTGREVYRRYQPTYTRSQLAFLGNDHLASSRYDGEKGWVEVLRVPGASQDFREN